MSGITKAGRQCPPEDDLGKVDRMDTPAGYGDPRAWLTGVLERILAGSAEQPTPLPWSWKATKLDAIFM